MTRHHPNRGSFLRMERRWMDATGVRFQVIDYLAGLGGHGHAAARRSRGYLSGAIPPFQRHPLCNPEKQRRGLAVRTSSVWNLEGTCLRHTAASQATYLIHAPSRGHRTPPHLNSCAAMQNKQMFLTGGVTYVQAR